MSNEKTDSIINLDDLKSLWRTFVKNWYIILSCLIVAYVSAYFYTYKLTDVYAASTQAAYEDIGLNAIHKFLFKVIVWFGLSYNGPTKIVVLPEKTTFDSDFYTKNVLPVVKEAGN